MKFVLLNFLCLFCNAINLKKYPPAPPPFAWWSQTYGDLVPTEVADTCGGWPGSTKWEEVNPLCVSWTVSLLKCAQVCNGSNRFTGFGDCMKTCGTVVPNSEELCEKDKSSTVPQNITDYCNYQTRKITDCGCTNFDPQVVEGEDLPKKFESSDDFHNCLASCAYNCDEALQLELDFGFKISWRDRKCVPLFFSCGGAKSGTCMKMPKCDGPFSKDCLESTCAPPLGNGVVSCFHDDPYCGGRSAFPDTINEETEGMLDFCTRKLEEGKPCSKYTKWGKADDYPECENDLVCSEDTNTCERVVDEEEVEEAVAAKDEAVE